MTERLYAQRGLFVPVSSASDLADLNVLEVRFPRAEHNHEFEVLRERGTLDIYPPEADLGPVKALADQLLTAPGSDDSEFDPMAKVATQWAKFTDAFEDILYALVYDLETPGAMRISEHAMRQLVHDNLETCCSIAGIYRTLDRRFPDAYPLEQTAFLKSVGGVIDHFAQEKGYNHIFTGQEYAKFVLRLEGVEVH